MFDRKPKALIRGLNILVLTLLSSASMADQITIAVASNFTSSLEKIRHAFEQQTDHEIRVVSGSSGRLFAQITNGAPFDIFMSADTDKPLALEQEAIIETSQRMPYALGQLVLWSSNKNLVVEGAEALDSPSIERLAVANPRVAPYGAAAVEVLRGLDKWESLAPRLVQGENIAQTFQFVESGNAQMGFVALSQVLEQDPEGYYWLVPSVLYQPILQEMAVLKRGEAINAFVAFLAGPVARKIIQESGYQLPDIY